MDEERIDLTPLDPAFLPSHWPKTVAATQVRIDAVLLERERLRDPLTTIAGWMKPLLVAAAVVIAILIPVEIALERAENRSEQVQQLVGLSTDWAQGHQLTGADLLRVLRSGGRQ
ncbi:MAG TPA: hypothetical protein VFI91_13525 [Longimicrobiaceae bacterium]|nr:hypothetical protein [Longimicrobiaceae bacterium]